MKTNIGVYVCQCGSNISDYVDVQKVCDEVSKTQGVAFAKVNMFSCSDATQIEIEDDIKSQKLDAIVVASCSPKLHLITFRNVAIRAGLNPYNYVQVNIREQCSWPHSDKPKDATEKAIRLVNAGIARARESQALTPISIKAENAVLVIGAGVSGMRSAIELANMGSKVILIEQNYFVGGKVSQWNELFTTNETGREVISKLYNEIMEHKKITLYTGAEVISKAGGVGNFDFEIKLKPRHVKPDCKLDLGKFNEAIDICPISVDDPFNYGLTKRKAIFKNYPGEFPEYPAIDFDNCNKCGECLKICEDVDLEQKEKIVNVNVGAVLLTTGADSYEPKTGEYAYNDIDNVITMQQFKRLIDLSDNELKYKDKKIKHISYIYCVGSRQEEEDGKKYCSRFCCTAAIHSAILVKEKFGDIKNYHFTHGVRTFGKQEILYNQANKQGDIFFQSSTDTPSEVIKEGNQTVVKVKDILTANREVSVDTDLVVLVTGMVPHENKSIDGILKVPIGADYFYNEIHPKLRPVETVIEGVHIAGTCQSPKNVMESVNSALSASIKANSLISKGEIELEPTLAIIDKDSCNYCDKCTDVCPYSAIKKVESKGKIIAEVIESNCKGCGMCLPVCPSNSVQLIGYTDAEIEGMIDGLLF